MMAPMIASPRILTIQSHVVSGYCGNKSATFPLQLLEFEVDVINSVQLSNHTQYATTRGQIFRSQDLEEIHAGLKENGLLKQYDHILSGYVADVSYIESMASMIKDIKDARSEIGLDCSYTLDPVLGDDDTGFYVPRGEEIAKTYKENLVPLANIITPNRFEASILSGVEIDSSPENALVSAMKAIEVFHNQGIRVVAITSFEIEDRKDELMCILSYSPSVNKGDLFAALITSWLHKTKFNIKESFENTINAIHEILEDTLAWCMHVNDGSVQSHELRLVQNKSRIMNPKCIFTAEKVDINSLSSK